MAVLWKQNPGRQRSCMKKFVFFLQKSYASLFNPSCLKEICMDIADIL